MTGRLIWAAIRRKPLGWAFHVLSLALGVAVVVALLAIDRGLDERFSRDLAGIDLVVSGKGSPLQIILSSVFQIDQPTGNIPLSTLARLKRNMLVKDAVPVSLGDNVGGYRIVGTSPAYGQLYGATLSAGGWWTAPLQAVLGAEVARDEHLKVGDTFVGEHGLARGGERHTATPYRVVGILAATGAVVDRLALTDIASVWKVHEHENAEHAAAVASEQRTSEGPDLYPAVGQQVTAILIRYRSVMGALMIPRLLKYDPTVQTAIPALELNRLNALLGTGTDVLRGFGIGLLALSALGFFVALLSAVQERQRELALLRALGGGPALLLRLVLMEALLLGFVGGVVGLLLGRVAAGIAARAVARGGGPALALPPIGPADLIIVAAAMMLALVAAIVPAIAAYRLRPAQVLRGDMKRHAVAIAMLLAPVGNANAQFYPGGQSKWGPLGNGTLEHEDDLRWVFFHDAKIAADEARGVYTAVFPPALSKENGSHFSITGYMMPVEATSTSAHFVLTRRSAGCPFCPPNEPTEAIEVFATKPVAYTQSPITVEGTLRLINQSAQGLFFRMDKARVE